MGLPDASVREARDRVRAAILSSGLSWPLRRITINLAPSGVRKGGAGLDLPIAIGLLVAAGELSPACTEGLAFCGELGLNGSLRHVPGMIALADASSPLGLVVPLCDVREAALVRGEDVHGAPTLGELCGILRGQSGWPTAPPPSASARVRTVPDLADVRGQAVGRRALEVAAAGRHHVLMIGPPGSGKTMLAERLPGLLPALSPDDALDSDAHPLRGRRRTARGRAGRPAAVPRPASPGLRRLARRRGQLVAPAGRGQPGHPRCPVPGRARRVPRRRPRGIAPATRGGRDPGEPRRWDGHLSGGLPPRGRDEPLSLRRGRLPGGLHVHARIPRSIPAPDLGAAPGPLRSGRPPQPAGPRRAARRPDGRADRGGGRPRRRRPGPLRGRARLPAPDPTPGWRTTRRRCSPRSCARAI